MELLLIRHALPIREEVDTGSADPALTEVGHAQAALLAEYLASERLDAIYSSPMCRARETAEALRKGRTVDGAPIEIVLNEQLAEYDRNSTAYVPVEELRAQNDPRWHDIVAGTWDSDEPPEVFQDRITSGIEQIINDHPGERVAVVCHGGVINAYLSGVLNIDGGGPAQFFYPNYTSIHRLMASSGGIRSIVTINETSHLRNSGLPMGLHQDGQRDVS